MIKMIALLKKNPNMTMEQLRDYYETKHFRIGALQLGNNNAARYVRRYFTPIPHPLIGEVLDCPYDMMMEIWFEDQAQMEAAWERFMVPEIAEEIAEDEARMFDRDEIRMFVVDEQDTDLSKTYT